MTQVLLIRHAVNDFVKTGRLAGWTPEVHLNDEGRAQAEALGLRLAGAPLAAIYSSPLERTMETAQAVAAYEQGIAVATAKGDVQAAREMAVFARRLRQKAPGQGEA